MTSIMQRKETEDDIDVVVDVTTDGPTTHALMRPPGCTDPYTKIVLASMPAAAFHTYPEARDAFKVLVGCLVDFHMKDYAPDHVHTVTTEYEVDGDGPVQ